MLVEFFTKLICCVKHSSRCDLRPRKMTEEHVRCSWKMLTLAHDELTPGRVGLVDVSPLLCLRCFHGGDVHGELTVAGEPFCGLLGMPVRRKNPFVLVAVLSLSIHGLTLLYCSHVYLLHARCFLDTHIH